MPGVVTLESAAAPAAQQSQVEMQTPSRCEDPPLVHQWEELFCGSSSGSQRRCACLRPTFVWPLAPSMDGGRTRSACWESCEWFSPGSEWLYMFEN